jgi:vacuolar-type H+-ATPase subunit F/Vma7
MATDNPQRRVLLIGKSQLVLDGALAGLRDLGYKAEATNDFADVTARFDTRDIDLVVFGGQLGQDLSAELREEISAINPRVIFVQGLAGIPGLIINQVQGAFARDRQEPVRAPTFTPYERSIADPPRPRRRHGDHLVADVVRATGPEERFAPAPQRPARRRRPRCHSAGARSAQGRLRHRAGRCGDLRLQHRHRAMTASPSQD